MLGAAVVVPVAGAVVAVVPEPVLAEPDEEPPVFATTSGLNGSWSFVPRYAFSVVADGLGVGVAEAPGVRGFATYVASAGAAANIGTTTK
jgi:hypothetical protein